MGTIIFCGDLNAHFEDLINDKNECVIAKCYPKFLRGFGAFQFDSVWNDKSTNIFTTWAGWMDREVKCCFDYILIGDIKNAIVVEEVLEAWNEEEIAQFDCKLPNKIYPSDHILIA